MNLTSSQIQAIASGEPVALTIDGTSCVILRQDIYDRVKPVIDYDDSEWTAEEMKTIMARTMGDDWSDPKMDVYDEPS